MQRTHEDHIHSLKHHKLSVTPIRLAVLAALDANPHVEAETIFNIVKKQITTASKQAIYNNLHALVDHGLLREIKPKGQSSLYESRVDDNHHHLVCRECNLVMDTDCKSVAPCLTPSNTHGFIIEEAEVVFWGICPKCQNKKN